MKNKVNRPKNTISEKKDNKKNHAFYNSREHCFLNPRLNDKIKLFDENLDSEFYFGFIKNKEI